MTLRNPWNIFGLVLGLVTALTGISTVAMAQGVVSTLVVGIAMALVGGAVATRLPFVGVRLSEGYLTYRGMFRTRNFRWSEIAGVTLEAVDDKLVATAYAPILQLISGAEFTLSILAGYSTARRSGNSRMARQTEVIRARVLTAG